MHTDSRQKYIWTCICTYTYTHLHVHIHTHTCIHIYIYICTYTYTYIYTWIHIHIHTHMYVHIHIYIYIYAYAHICIFIYISTTRACAPMQRCSRFVAMEAIANLSLVLREHRAGRRFRLPSNTSDLSSRSPSCRPVARLCLLKESLR